MTFEFKHNEALNRVENKGTLCVTLAERVNDISTLQEALSHPFEPVRKSAIMGLIRLYWIYEHVCGMRIKIILENHIKTETDENVKLTATEFLEEI